MSGSIRPLPAKTVPFYLTAGVATLTGKSHGAIVLPYSEHGWGVGSPETLVNLAKTGGNVGGVVGYIFEHDSA